jgi:replication factor A1
VSGLNDVTVKGEVISLYPPTTFDRQNHTEGKVSTMYLRDESGTVKVTLWDEQVKFVEDGRVHRGDLVKVLHGYVRVGINGRLEIHIGSRGRLQILPS